MIIQAAQAQTAAPQALRQELAEAHKLMLANMAALEAETAKRLPDMAAVATIRFRLAQASRRRGTLVDTLIGLEVRRRTGASLAEVISLQERARAARTASTAHIAHWTPALLDSDWRGYCAASAQLRRSMRQQIDAENRVLIAPGLSGAGA